MVVGTVVIIITILPPVPRGVGIALAATDTVIRLRGCLRVLIVSILVLVFLDLVLVGLLVGRCISPDSLNSSPGMSSC